MYPVSVLQTFQDFTKLELVIVYVILISGKYDMLKKCRFVIRTFRTTLLVQTETTVNFICSPLNSLDWFLP
jgi:hypothetical protein